MLAVMVIRCLLLAFALVACTSTAAPPAPTPSAPPAPTSAPPAPTPSAPPEPLAEVTLRSPDGQTRTVWAEVADEPAERQRGLMFRTSLPAGTGMLFVFESERRGAFWMKDTLIPLSIAFADADGEILRIMDMEPCNADPCPRYDPGVAYAAALEVAQGQFEDWGVAPGWRLDLREE